MSRFKRKAVVPKKGSELENETSPSGPRSVGFSSEDAVRLVEMETRVMNLEERLTNALEAVQEARSHEMGLMMVMREIIGHLATIDKGEEAAARSCS